MEGLYYRHSGKWQPGMALLGLSVGSAIGFVLAAVYAYAILYIPIIGYFTFLLTGGLGLFTGGFAAAMLKTGKVRNNAVAFVVGLGAGVVTLWAAWLFWTHATLRDSGVKVPLADLFLHPSWLWQAIVKINETGAWKFRGSTPSGIPLWILWGIEAAIIVGVAAFACHGIISDLPFCESCEKWCEREKGVGICGTSDVTNLRDHLEQRSFHVLERLVPDGADEWFRWDIDGCKNCGATNALDVRAIKQTYEKGKRSLEEKTIVEELLVSQSEATELRAIAKRLKDKQDAADAAELAKDDED